MRQFHIGVAPSATEPTGVAIAHRAVLEPVPAPVTDATPVPSAAETPAAQTRTSFRQAARNRFASLRQRFGARRNRSPAGPRQESNQESDGERAAGVEHRTKSGSAGAAPSWLNADNVLRAAVYVPTAAVGGGLGILLAVLYLLVRILAVVFGPLYRVAFPSAHPLLPILAGHPAPDQPSSRGLVSLNLAPHCYAPPAVATPVSEADEVEGSSPNTPTHSITTLVSPLEAEARRASGNEVLETAEAASTRAMPASNPQGNEAGGSEQGIEEDGSLTAKSRAVAHGLAAKGGALVDKVTAKLAGAGDKIAHALGAGGHHHSDNPADSHLEAQAGSASSLRSLLSPPPAQHTVVLEHRGEIVGPAEAAQQLDHPATSIALQQKGVRQGDKAAA
ncbi:hypothetical protein HaLaN_12064 [Haematococcus lacustris]|uniref:Uncharacterized protein n=1 Tax=Haematococcus lacustris TaxID=44745 RepID=A0A699ZJ91_HAELA|nr:hypothetical protein HaLaN_12064 [Haematococcus lacustris]